MNDRVRASCLNRARDRVAGDASNTAFCIKRGEQKYQIDGIGDLHGLRREVERYIPLHEYTPGRDTTIVESLYFDNDARELFRPSNADGAQTHVRLRSYRYEDEASTCEYWMETKIRNGVVTKHRFRIGRELVDPFLRGDDVEREVLARNRESGDKSAIRRAYATTRGMLRRLDLKPMLLVRYRRTAFQNDSERLSLDCGISYFPVIGCGRQLPAAEHIAAAREKFTLLEIKYPVGAFPVWMESLQHRCRMVERKHFSKFDRGMTRLSHAVRRNLSTQETV